MMNTSGRKEERSVIDWQQPHNPAEVRAAQLNFDDVGEYVAFIERKAGLPHSPESLVTGRLASLTLIKPSKGERGISQITLGIGTRTYDVSSADQIWVAKHPFKLSLHGLHVDVPKDRQ